MFHRILVPLDGSTLAECVLPHVVALAEATDAAVTLVHVVEQTTSSEQQARPIDPLSWRFRQAEAKSYLNSITSQLREADLRVPIDTVLLEGQPAERIVELAHNADVDLIALSSHGRTGLSGWNVSSIVQRILLRAYTSVFIARAYQDKPLTTSSSGYQRILVPLDGSQRAEYVLPLLGILAEKHRAKILLAHVVAQPEMPRRAPLTREETELGQRLIELNREYMVGYFDHLKSRLPERIETQILVDDNTVAALHSLAEGEAVDLVILTAHGYSAIRKYPYGQVGISFITYGTTPLLIIQDLPQKALEAEAAEGVSSQETQPVRTPIYDKPSI